MLLDHSDWAPATRAVWAGQPERNPEGATVTPVFHGVTFAYDDIAEWRAAAMPAHSSTSLAIAPDSLTSSLRFSALTANASLAVTDSTLT